MQLLLQLQLQLAAWSSLVYLKVQLFLLSVYNKQLVNVKQIKEVFIEVYFYVHMCTVYRCGIFIPSVVLMVEPAAVDDIVATDAVVNAAGNVPPTNVTDANDL